MHSSLRRNSDVWQLHFRFLLNLNSFLQALSNNMRSATFLVVVAVTLFLAATCSAQDFGSPAKGLTIVQPAALKNEYKNGMPHSVALFGVPHYGKKLAYTRIYDAMNNTEMSGCNGWKADPAWGRRGAFIVLVNRGECHFTQKVRYAQGQGAAAVIIKDNVLLQGEPGSYCPDYAKPITTGPEKTTCLATEDYTTCKCESTGKAPIALPSVPRCADGSTAIYEATDCKGESSPCWACSNTNDRFPLSCLAGGHNCLIESREPFMADDGTGGSISIPSFLVSDFDGQNLRNAILKEPTFITMSWDIAQRKEVNYEIWTSSEDHNGAEFKRDFQELAIDLSPNTNFRPRFFIYDGEYRGCVGGACGSQCILNGRYCGPDPDGDLNDKISGADIVKENLRQICIFKVLTSAGGNDPAKTKKLQQKWWCYANDFANNCYGEEGPMRSSGDFAACAVEQMRKVGLDQVAVNKCMADAGGVDCPSSGTCQKNTLLEQEIRDRSNYGIISLPSIVVNGVLLRTATGSGGAAEQTTAEAICNSFASGFAPQRCDRILNPMGTGNAGIATVTFTATLSSDVGSSFSYTPDVCSRLQDTLAMKLGVERLSINIGRPKIEGGTATVEVELTRLMCTDQMDETETVTQMLNRVNTCQGDSQNAADASKELDSLAGKAFYFHTYVRETHVIHVVTAKISNPTKACLAHDGVKGGSKGGGVSVIAFVVVILLVLAAGGGGGFVWYRRVRNDMKDQVQSILAQYQPLEEIVKGRDESETAAML